MFIYKTSAVMRKHHKTGRALKSIGCIHTSTLLTVDCVKCFHVLAFAIQSSNLELLLCEE